MGKSYTLSLHNQGSAVKQAHNRREQSALGHNSFIDSTRTKDNIVMVDIPVRAAYESIFGKAVQEYNNRARTDRQIKDYWATINSDSRKHAAYEVIVQVGSMAEGAPDRAVDALKRYVQGWSRANPNLALVGAYIHNDESTPHLHLDYIPVAECSRGMKLQNTLTGALKAQGFVTSNSRNTAQMQWEQSERARMRSICRKMNIDLLAEGDGHKYMSIPQYKQYADSLGRLEQQQAAEQAQFALIIQQEDKAIARTAKQQALEKQARESAEKWQRTEEQSKQDAENWNGFVESARAEYKKHKSATAELQDKAKQLEGDLFYTKQQIADKADTLSMLTAGVDKKFQESCRINAQYRDLYNNVLLYHTAELVRAEYPEYWQEKEQQAYEDLQAQGIMDLNEINDQLEEFEELEI